MPHVPLCGWWHFAARHAGEANKNLGLCQDLEADTEQGLGVSVPVGVMRHRATLTASLVNMALSLEPRGPWGHCLPCSGCFHPQKMRFF